LPEDYEVPVFHAMSTENEALAWDFWVRHYENDALQQRDKKYRAAWDGQPENTGILYPRAGCLGGCTAHNALFLIYPHNADWDDLVRITGDASWAAENMRRYFERIEDCRHRLFLYRWLAKLGYNPTRHGFGGWLSTETAIPFSGFFDLNLVKTLARTVWAALREVPDAADRSRWFLEGCLDPNDWRLVRDDAFGLRYSPLTTDRHARHGTRERLIEVQRRHPDKLAIELNALATRVLFQGKRAIGVEYLKGDRLYRAHKRRSEEAGLRCEARAARDVILAGGAFNTPQLLMLSGIVPADHLREHGIEPRIPLPGVGRNLQDRYEIGVVNRMRFDYWKILAGARYAKDDRQCRAWARRRRGVYTTNGGVLCIVKRSLPDRILLDLYCFAMLGRFAGYYPGYSREIPAHLNALTWAILKAHTENRAGRVRLRSADPRETPCIDFRYFDEGNDKSGMDLASVVEGIKFVRKLTAPLKARGLIAEEELPGAEVQSDEALREYVEYQAWGHHASCTCAIGTDGDPLAVLDGDFRVRGTENVRVVDASIFPRIPGFFIVSSIYMAAEKAADVLLAGR
jgi:choline dehydrogenase